LENSEYAKTTVNLEKTLKIGSLKIAKKKGINTLTTLVNILLADYIEKNRELLERKI
jgi:hypothetical protein